MRERRYPVAAMGLHGVGLEVVALWKLEGSNTVGLADLSTDLLLRYALQRRALAFDQFDLISDHM